MPSPAWTSLPLCSAGSWSLAHRFQKPPLTSPLSLGSVFLYTLWAPCSRLSLMFSHCIVMICWLLCPTHLSQHTCEHICIYTCIHAHGHTRLCFSWRQWPFLMIFIFLILYPSAWYIKVAFVDFCWMNEYISSDTWTRQEGKDLQVFCGSVEPGRRSCSYLLCEQGPKGT